MRGVFPLLILCSTAVAVAQPLSPLPAFKVQSMLAADKCGTFLEQRRPRSGEYTLYLTWVQGYITAYNQFAPSEKGVAMSDIAKGTDVNEWGAWIEQYCVAHPFDTFFEATTAMMKFLGALDPVRDRNRWK